MSTHLIVPLVASDGAAQAAAAAQASGASLVELRVDLIGDSAVVESLLGNAGGLRRWILTIRGSDEGGHWDGGDDERIALYEHLGLLSPGWIDVEFALWRRSANIRQKIALVAEIGDTAKREGERTRSALILSSHNLSATPDDGALADLLSRIRAARPAVAKIVTSARDGRDSLRVLSLLAREAANGPLIALAMREAGVMTRILAPKFGAWGNFASMHGGAESAPGQITIDDLRHRYRYDSVNAATRVFGVLGWPVAQSRSPLVHNAAMAHHAIDGVYVPIPIEPDRVAFFEFMDRVAAEPSLGFEGFSVTIPHKEHALAWLESRKLEVSPRASRCRAVNTLIRDAGGWRGENTDALGAWAAIEPHLTAPAAAAALVLGAGGVARAVVAILIDHGVAVTIANRTRRHAQSLAEDLGGAVIDWNARGESTPSLLINCTSVGMWPDIEQSPFAAESLRAETIVFDTIYNPAQTRLLRNAADVGCRTVSGLEMFLRQAAAQYELWHARSAPLEVMWDTILKAEMESDKR